MLQDGVRAQKKKEAPAGLQWNGTMQILFSSFSLLIVDLQVWLIDMKKISRLINQRNDIFGTSEWMATSRLSLLPTISWLHSFMMPGTWSAIIPLNVQMVNLMSGR
jgi:hypothetical protein